MGFSLAGFGAGISESIVERIDEERKFSNLALQGRIERASVLKQQREKEAAAIEEELRQRRDALVEMKVEDPDLQKAYLTSPMAFEALRKAKTSGIDVDPAALITVNKDKLFSGTPDELIKNAARPTVTAEPAKVLEGEGGSLLAPTTRNQQRRLEQLASARGMTLQEVATAESGVKPQMPTPAASVNFDLLKKEDKKTWKQKLEGFETNYADAVQQFGEGSKEATVAKNRLDAYRVTTANMTEEQMDHAKKLSRAQAIVFDKSMTNVTEQDRQWAANYLKEYDAYRRKQEAENKPDEKIPTTNSLISIGRTAGANAVRDTFGTSAASKQLSFVTNADGSTSMQYSGNDPTMQAQLIRREREGVVASLRPYMTPDGKVMDKKIESALQAFGIRLDDNRRPIVPDAPAMPEKPAKPRTAGDVVSSAPAAAPAPAPTTRNIAEGTRSKSKSGKDIIYRNGQWEYL